MKENKNTMQNVISDKRVQIIGIVLTLLVIVSLMVGGYREDKKDLQTGFVVKSEQFKNLLND